MYFFVMDDGELSIFGGVGLLIGQNNPVRHFMDKALIKKMVDNENLKQIVIEKRMI